MYGDNIYFEAEGQWHQADSHHSNDDGTVNTYNLKRDTSCRFVLVSEHFFYFGSKAVRIPGEFLAQDGECICKKGPGYRWRFADNFVFSFIEWLEGNHKPGYQSVRRLPKDWKRRYGADIAMVETFVDTTRYVGTCYKAANWLKIGQTKGRSRQDRYSKLKVSVKDILVYPLLRDFRKLLLA